MIIAGIERTSLVDWPEKICSTVFIAGCNFRCPFCHNPELVLPEEVEKLEPMTETELLTALVERKRYIDGVCITGGEPLLSPDLIPLLRKIKAKGFEIKLDTNGSIPTILKKIIDERLVEYVAMDIKGPKERYPELTNSKINPNLVEESVKILRTSNISHEFRTTVVRSLLKPEDIEEIGRWLDGSKAYYIQQFDNSQKMIDGTYCDVRPYTPEELKEMLESVKDNFQKAGVRGI
jgi:pyruvate formate lyase activating enzyme